MSIFERDPERPLQRACKVSVTLFWASMRKPSQLSCPRFQRNMRGVLKLERPLLGCGSKQHHKETKYLWGPTFQDTCIQHHKPQTQRKRTNTRVQTLCMNMQFGPAWRGSAILAGSSQTAPWTPGTRIRRKGSLQAPHRFGVLSQCMRNI